MTGVVDAPIALEIIAVDSVIIEVFSAVYVPGPAPYADVVARAAAAGAAVGAFRILRASAADVVAHADKDERAHAGRIVGISLAAAAPGESVRYATHGPVTNVAWALAALQPVYCGDDGLIVQVKPTGAWSQRVGIALSATTILVDPWPPEFTDGTPTTVRVICAEAVEAGDWLTFEYSAPDTLARLARANEEGYDAEGFAEVTTTAGSAIVAQLAGSVNRYAVNDGNGRQYLSATPGKCAAAPPESIGTVIQSVGKRVAGGVLFMPGEPILRVAPPEEE